MLDAFVKDYGWFIAFVVLGGIWVYFGGRKAIISKLEKNINSTKKLPKIY